MEIGLSHIVIAALAFVVGLSMRRKPIEPIPSRVAPATPNELTAEPDLPPLAERLFKILFLSGWLIAWTVGIVMAAGMFISTLGKALPATLFVGGWLIAALAGWVWATRTLIHMIQGRPDAFNALRRGQ